MSYSHVTTAIQNELQNLQQLEKWREKIDLDEFAKNPLDYIEENAPPLLAPFELWRYGEHFAKDKTEKDGAHARARVQLKYMLARRAANPEGGGDIVEHGSWQNFKALLDVGSKKPDTPFHEIVDFLVKQENKMKTKLNF